MKKSYLAPYCIALTIGNIILPSHMARIADHVALAYVQILGKGRRLPYLTEIALLIPLWFYALAALSILATLGLFIQKVPVSILAHWLIVLLIIECLTLFCFAIGVCLPIAMVTWEIGN